MTSDDQPTIDLTPAVGHPSADAVDPERAVADTAPVVPVEGDTDETTVDDDDTGVVNPLGPAVAPPD